MGGVIGKAQSYLGLPYVWGSASPSNGGFDCSGFISYIFGVGRQDVRGYWNSVSKVDSPQPGDLVFFQGTYKAGPSHIGIYVGNGQMLAIKELRTVILTVHITKTFLRIRSILGFIKE